MSASPQTAHGRHAASGHSSHSGNQMLAFGALPEHGDDPAEALGASLAAILSSDLLRGKKAVSITHNGATYRLQATRLGKLILTK